jgi:hypothetical protein
MHDTLRVEMGNSVDQLLHDQLDVALAYRRAVCLAEYGKREQVAARCKLGEQVPWMR